MNTNKDKVQDTEFEEKLRQSTSAEQISDNQEKVIPVVEEKLHVDVEKVETGRVHVSKQVHEEEVTVDVPFVHDEVDVKRVAKNISVDKAPEVRYDGDTMIIPVLKEEVVVQKRLVLVEELHITKKRIEEHRPQQVTLKKEEVKIKRS
ncbi:YsnF/AvaK domain-containing protein [Pontibacter locisalis]|uniref:YsnF/AvaK domain-containing protein n=1 Tax=Pontibacter locisalis TaxID=1719035 RepID=A0ABW5IHP2_9BACT